MTKKHYKNLAEALGIAIGQHSDGTPEREEFASDVLEAVMDALASENPKRQGTNRSGERAQALSPFCFG